MLTPETILQGRYRIVRQLGQGGMGAVYEAIDQRLDTTVALKETLFVEERLTKQFEREARLLARLHHPALPRVSDHFSEGDGQFLVMQFIPGDDLSEMMNRKRAPFPPHQVLSWADQLLDALDYLHTQDPQIIHRDIKPQNLKLTSRGQIILLDFGLAKGQAGDISRVTTSASIFGYTPNYAPLEQIQGQGTDPRSDLYALGATLYHLMTNVKPPDALTRAAALVNGQPDPLENPSQVNSEISPEVDEMLLKSMAQSRDQRYANAAEMREALHGSDQATTVTNRGEAETILKPPSSVAVGARTAVEARQKTTAGTAGETTVVRPSQQSSSRRVLPWILTAAAAVVVVACGAFALNQFRSRESSVVQVASGPSPQSSAPSASPTASATASTSVSTPEPKPHQAVVANNEEQAQIARKEKQKADEAQRKIEEKRATTVVAPQAPTPPETHQERATNKRDEGGEDQPPNPNRGRRNPQTHVTAGGVVIRNFPDGSQMITTPDGMRVFIDKNGKKQVLRPGQKPIRNPQPNP